MLLALSRHPLLRRTIAAAVPALCVAVSGAAQTRWTIASRASLAWWQVSPHLNHLWATTCPEEPSWRAGEGRSSGWSSDGTVRNLSRTGFQNVPDTVHVPIYPRLQVHHVCPVDAVTGALVLPDTVTWRGAHGEVVVKAVALTSGEEMRDQFARGPVLLTDVYPDIKFTLDSLVDVSRQGDTLRATAMGILSLHGAMKPVSATVQAFLRADSTRVLARIRMPARALITTWGVSRHALGLGVGLDIWKDFFIGVDLVAVPEPAGTR